MIDLLTLFYFVFPIAGASAACLIAGLFRREHEETEERRKTAFELGKDNPAIDDAYKKSVDQHTPEDVVDTEESSTANQKGIPQGKGSMLKQLPSKGREALPQPKSREDFERYKRENNPNIDTGRVEGESSRNALPQSSRNPSPPLSNKDKETSTQSSKQPKKPVIRWSDLVQCRPDEKGAFQVNMAEGQQITTEDGAAIASIENNLVWVKFKAKKEEVPDTVLEAVPDYAGEGV